MAENIKTPEYNIEELKGVGSVRVVSTGSHDVPEGEEKDVDTGDYPLEVTSAPEEKQAPVETQPSEEKSEQVEVAPEPSAPVEAATESSTETTITPVFVAPEQLLTPESPLGTLEPDQKKPTIPRWVKNVPLALELIVALVLLFFALGRFSARSMLYNLSMLFATLLLLTFVITIFWRVAKKIFHLEE